MGPRNAREGLLDQHCSRLRTSLHSTRRVWDDRFPFRGIGMPAFSGRPLYLQLCDVMADRIATRAWKPGSPLPNEGDLAREFGVSPGTVRKALERLEQVRLITRGQGRGSVVCDLTSGELVDRLATIRGADRGNVVANVGSVEIRTSGSDCGGERSLGFSAGGPDLPRPPSSPRRGRAVHDREGLDASRPFPRVGAT